MSKKKTPFIISIMLTTLLMSAITSTSSADEAISDKAAELLQQFMQQNHFQSEKTSISVAYSADSLWCLTSEGDTSPKTYSCTIKGSDLSENTKRKEISFTFASQGAELIFQTISKTIHSGNRTNVLIKNISCTQEVESDESEDLETICTFDNKTKDTTL